jgi:predicted transcriptional regulator YheO
MKINVTVDLSEFFTEDDDMSFSDQVKEDISNRINRTIWESLNKEMVSAFENQVKRKIELDKDLKIAEKINDLFINQKLKKSQWGESEMVSLSEFIELELAKNFSPSRDFDHKVERLVKDKADGLVKELKDRYDLLFASQIVAKLNENGMLADDVGKMLLG